MYQKKNWRPQANEKLLLVATQRMCSYDAQRLILRTVSRDTEDVPVAA